MHYRTSGIHGTRMGRKVAKWLTTHYFQPVDCKGEKGHDESDNDSGVDHKDGKGHDEGDDD